jgi:hypothetical protein
MIATLLITNTGFAQSTSGTIVGTLTDSVGGVIPGTQVILINVATATKTETTTDAVGYFQFFNVPPADYKLQVQKQGFKELTNGPFKLEVEGSLRVDLKMQVGSQAETVTVTADAPLIQAESTTLGSVIDERQATELPLNGRNPMALTALTPSVIPMAGSTGNQVAQNPFAFGNFQIGGGFSNQSLVYVDGAPVNTAYINLVSLIPTQDSIDQFKVDTNDLTAEYGHLAGGAIQFSTKSGTNQLHGAAWEYVRNTIFNANTWFGNAGNQPRGGFHQNQFGANAGGPIFIPHVYDGHNKAFWFFDWEGFKTGVAATTTETVPTAAEVNGNMTLLPVGTNANNTTSAPTVYDPLTTCLIQAGCPATAGTTTGANYGDRLPFAGNIIPTARINTVAQNYINLFYPITAVGTNNLTNNYIGQSPTGGSNYQTVGKVDYQISEKQQISSRFSAVKVTNLPFDPLTTGMCQDRCAENFTTYNWVGNDSYIFNPNTILDVRLSYLRFVYLRQAKDISYTPASIGQTLGNGAVVEFPGPPTVSISGFDTANTFGSNGADSSIGDHSDNDRISGDLTKIMGKHTLKFGGEYLRMTFNFYQANNSSGEATVNGTFTNNNANTGTLQNTGSGLATFLLGYTTGAMQYLNVNEVTSELLYPAVFVTDDWRVSNKFTAHVGLRWENNYPWTDRANNISYFDPNQVNPILANAGITNYVGSFEVVDSATRASRRGIDTLDKQISPRVGFSYELNPKTVISAGYGIFWIPIEVSFNTSPNNDYVNSNTTSSIVSLNNNNTPAPTNNFSNPIPGGFVAPPGRSTNPVTGFQYVGLGQGSAENYPDNPYAYAQQWNFAIQRQLGPSMMVNVAYAGAKGTHLALYGLNKTALPQQYFNTDPANLTLIQETNIPNPFFGVINPNYGSGASTITEKTLLSPHPQYSGMSEASADWGDDTYHSLQVKFQKRFSGGASIGAGYTFAKLISSTETMTSWTGDAAADVWGVIDPNRIDLEKSVSSENVSQRLVVSYVYDIPVGRGKAILQNANAVTDEILGGWGVEGLSTFQAGFPLSIGGTPNANGVFGYGQRPAVIANCNRMKQTSGAGGHTSTIPGKQWFNPACYTNAAELTFGESRNDAVAHGPGIDNTDASIFKNFSIWPENKASMQFRAEFFNFFNRTQFAGIDTGIYDGTAGTAGGTNGNPRLVQFALRLKF